MGRWASPTCGLGLRVSVRRTPTGRPGDVPFKQIGPLRITSRLQRVDFTTTLHIAFVFSFGPNKIIGVLSALVLSNVIGRE